jgi:sugar/nucleoside kinase (ribokinase family)
MPAGDCFVALFAMTVWGEASLTEASSLRAGVADEAIQHRSNPASMATLFAGLLRFARNDDLF